MLHLNLWGGRFRLSVRNLIVDASSCSSQKYYCGTCTAVKDQSTSPSAAVQLYLLTDSDWSLISCYSVDPAGGVWLCVSLLLFMYKLLPVVTADTAAAAFLIGCWRFLLSVFVPTKWQHVSACTHTTTQIHRNTHSHALIQVLLLLILIVFYFLNWRLIKSTFLQR